MSDFIAYIPRFELNNFCFYLALYLPMHLQQREKALQMDQIKFYVFCLLFTV